MYTSHERVERDGFLVAYEGEVMSDEEATRRGLLVPGDAHDGDDGTGAPAEEAKPPTNDELRAMLDERGVPYDKKANKTTLLALVAETEPGGDPGDGAEDDLYVDDDDDGEDA